MQDNLVMTEKNLSADVISVLEKAVNDSIVNLEVVVHDESGAGKGYLGEMVFLSITNKRTNETHDVVVKQGVPTKTEIERNIMDITFSNEINFYQKIWKVLDKFQREFPKVEPFDRIPRCYASSNEFGNKKVVLENLKHSGFEMFPRDVIFDDVKTKFLMESYGRFHGISAAYREHNPEEYRTFKSELRNGTESILKLDFTRNFILFCMRQMHDMIENEKIREKLKIYCDSGVRLALEALRYSGRNPVLLHGDCWSNNIMVKFNAKGDISDIRMVDFQLCSISSVVTDLSYLLYSAASPIVINNLDYYLKIYHDSFSTTLHDFNLDSSRIFTFDDLKMEWKDHSHTGFFIGQMMWFTKLKKNYDQRNLVEINESKSTESEEDEMPLSSTFQVEKLKEILVNLAQHLYDNGYI